MNPQIKLEDAQREQCRASICIEGLSGDGKTGLALLLGYVLAGEDWSKVGACDTENKSMNLYVGLKAPDFEYGRFKLGQLTADIGYKPSNYLAYRQLMIEQGCKSCVFDSITHSWQQKGGVLDLVSAVQSKAKDKYAAWGDETVAPEKNNLIALYRDSNIHCITTVRLKEKMEYGVDEATGKTKLISLGEQQIQQADMKYEPDLVLRMVSPGSSTKYPVAEVIKTRYATFEKGQRYEFNLNICRQLKAYLEEGANIDDILAKQKEEYVEIVKSYLDEHKNAQAIWKVIKKDAGFGDTKLEDIPLNDLKTLFIKLID